MPTRLLAEVAALLRAERVEISLEAKESTPLIVTVFQVEGRPTPVLIFADAAREYLVLMALTDFAPSRSRHLDSISAETLRAIIRAQDSAPLAKVQFLEPPGLWGATSQCSTREMTGVKIRRRLEDCAKLGHNLSALLSSVPDSPPSAG
jgi:hypothetical protein